MIVSHTHRFIFIKTNKTAGTSIEIALSALCGSTDILTPLADEDELIRFELTGKHAQNYKFPGGTLRAHSSASEIRSILAADEWESYFKFCFERHPLDKAVSHYYWQRRNKTYLKFKDYLLAGELANIKASKLYTIAGKIAVDRIFQYEEIHTALDELSKILKLPQTLTLPLYRAKGQHRPAGITHEDIIAPHDQQLIQQFFAKEMQYAAYNKL